MIAIGTVCQIIDCKEIPGINGSIGEIVDLQSQENELSMQYPVWMKIVSGQLIGNMYGFNYHEIREYSTH